MTNVLDTQLSAVSEVKALATNSGINGWLQEKVGELAKAAGGTALEWVSVQFFKAIGSDSDLDQIKKLLDQISDLEHEVLAKLDELLQEVQFQALITRSFDSVERIKSTYSRFTNLGNVPSSEVKKEMKVLINGILDSNSGILLDLQTIHDVLAGNDPLSPKDPGVLEIFMERWLVAYRENQLKPDVPLATYPNKSYAYLHGLYIIQYLGISLLANARVYNNEFALLEKEVRQIAENLAVQKNVLDGSIPAWVNKYPYSLFDKRWYVVNSFDNSSEVMYGSPGGTGYYLDYTVQFRDRHENNGDEEWMFVPTDNNDTFNLVERSRPNYINNPGGISGRLTMGEKDSTTAQFRIVMSERKQMVLGIVNVGALNWVKEGTNICTPSTWDSGTEVAINYSGH